MHGETFCWLHRFGHCWTCPPSYYPDLSTPSTSPLITALRSVEKFKKERLR